MLRAAPAKVPALPDPLLPFHLPDSTKLPCTSWLAPGGAAGGALLVPQPLLLPSEPTSVLDIRSPSPSSTLSSSLAASSDGGFGSVDESGAVAVSGLFCDGGASDGQSLSDDGSGAPWDADDLHLPDNELPAPHPRDGIGPYGGPLKTTAAAAAAMPHHAPAPPFRSVPSGNQVALIQGSIKRQKEAVFAPPGCGSNRCVINQLASPDRIVKDEPVADGSLEACVMPYRRKRDREDLLGEIMGSGGGGGGGGSARASIVSCKTASEWFHHPEWSELPSASASASAPPAPAATVTADDKGGAEFAWPVAGSGGSSAQLDLYEAMQVLYPSGGTINSSAATSQPTVAAAASMFPNSTPPAQRLPIPTVPPPAHRHLGTLLNAAPPLLNAAAYGAPAPQFQDLPFPKLRPSLAAPYKFRPAPQFSSVPNLGSFAAGETTAWPPVEQQRLAYGRHPVPPPPLASATAGEMVAKRRAAPPGLAAERVGRCVQVEELWRAEHQLSLAAEAAAHGDIATAQAILARLNQRSSSPPKGLLQQHQRSPSERAIFHFKEALARRIVPPPSSASSSAAGTLAPPPPYYYSLLPTSPADIIGKISAYKSFCDASPIPQFAHFMANQAILDATEGEACIHVIDFELGLGGQWASLIQEMAQRSGGCAALAELKITTVVGEEALETRLARENLLQFGKEVGMRVQVEAMGIAKLEAAMGKRGTGTGAVVVNFGIGLSRVAAHFQTAEALLGFLQWLRALTPKVVAVSESEPAFVLPEGSSGGSGPGTSQLMEALQFYACVLESLDAAVAVERLTAAALAEVEAQVIAPRIGEAGGAAAAAAGGWAVLLHKAGFGPRRWSVAAEGQAACLAAAAASCGVAGFSVRKQQEALQLAWFNKPLVSASAWA